MSKLYFKYGAMGASKSAHALITKFNYEQNGSKVLLLKPAIDTRDGANVIRSRIGLKAEAFVIREEDDIFDLVDQEERYDVIICDEAQFFTPDIIDALHHIATFRNIPVICYGLLTDFQTHLFPGSKRLIEVAESFQEIKMVCLVCRCGRKATVNGRFTNGKIVTDGELVVLGGNDTYQAMCYKCYREALAERNMWKKDGSCG